MGNPYDHTIVKLCYVNLMTGPLKTKREREKIIGLMGWNVIRNHWDQASLFMHHPWTLFFVFLALLFLLLWQTGNPSLSSYLSIHGPGTAFVSAVLWWTTSESISSPHHFWVSSSWNPWHSQQSHDEPYFRSLQSLLHYWGYVPTFTAIQ